MNEIEIEKFSTFKEEDWINYIQKLCYGLNPTPSLRFLSTILQEKLFWVYSNLSEFDKTLSNSFTKSLIHFLRSEEPKKENALILHSLIYFILEVEPILYRKLVELIIRDEKYTDIYWGDTNLHLLLIKAYTNIEDTEKMYLEEYLTQNSFGNLPAFLYITASYYTLTGHNKKALDLVKSKFENNFLIVNESYCEALYFTLTQLIPNYINLDEFVEFFIENQVNLIISNNYLQASIRRFIEDLYFEYGSDHCLVAFTEDVLLNYRKNYYQLKYDPKILSDLRVSSKLGELCIKFSKSFKAIPAIYSAESENPSDITELSKEVKKVINQEFEELKSSSATA